MSATDKNLNARANSNKHKTTLTWFSHQPDEGNPFSKPGKIAKRANGSPSAIPNPAMPTVRFQAPPPPLEDALASNPPRIGPVHEKETNASVIAMKKIPINPPRFAFLSALLVSLLGIVISKAPKKDIAKTGSNKKKKRFSNLKKKIKRMFTNKV